MFCIDPLLCIMLLKSKIRDDNQKNGMQKHNLCLWPIFLLFKGIFKCVELIWKWHYFEIFFNASLHNSNIQHQNLKNSQLINPNFKKKSP
jgi:hypothetical protein